VTKRFQINKEVFGLRMPAARGTFFTRVKKVPKETRPRDTLFPGLSAQNPVRAELAFSDRSDRPHFSPDFVCSAGAYRAGKRHPYTDILDSPSFPLS